MASWSDFMNSTPFGGFFDSGSGNKKKAGADENAAVDAYGQVQAPTFSPVEQQKANQQQGQVTDAGPTEFNNINTNPAYTQAQTAQLAALQNLSANGGRSAASDANLAQVQQQENANAKGQRDAVMSNMAARGQGGSGNALLAQLSAQQGDQNNQSERDLGVLGQQSQTAIQAGQAAAGIGSNLQQQQYNQQAQRAAAQDSINRFNSGQATGMSQFNAGQGNQLGEFNAGQGNQISALNNYTMPQAQFTDSLDKAKGVAGAYQTDAAYNTGQQDRSAKKQGQLWNGAFNAFKGTDTGSSAMEGLQSLAKGGEVKPVALAPKSPALRMVETGPISNPSNKEAMLSALQNIRRKSMGPKV